MGATHLDYIVDGASGAVQLDSPGAGGSEGWGLEASRDYRRQAGGEDVLPRGIGGPK